MTPEMCRMELKTDRPAFCSQDFFQLSVTVLQEFMKCASDNILAKISLPPTVQLAFVGVSA